MAHLHPTGHHHHPERPERLAILLEALGGRAATARARAASRSSACHDAGVRRAIASIHEETWLDGDTLAGPTTWEAARLAAGCAIEAVEAGGFALVRPPGPPRAAPATRWGSASSTTSPSRPATRRTRSASSASRSSTGTSTTATAPRRSSAATTRCSFVSLHQWPFYPGSGGPGTSDEHDAQRPARRRAPATRSTRRRSRDSSSRPSRRSIPSS